MGRSRCPPPGGSMGGRDASLPDLAEAKVRVIHKRVQSSFSTQHLHSVVGLFKDKDKQRQIVERMGFTFVYHIHKHQWTDRRLIAWLYSRINVQDKCLELEDGRRAFITADEVAIMLGVPRGGKLLREVPVGDPSDAKSAIASILAVDGSRPGCSWLKAERVLRKLAVKDSLSAAEERAFAASLAIVAVGSFLAPRSGKDNIDSEVMVAISDDLLGVQAYDWAQYVVDSLFECAVDVQEQLTHHQNFGVEVSGCTLFVLVLFMEVLGGQVAGLDPGAIPRMKAYTPELLKTGIKKEAQKRKSLLDTFLVSHMRSLFGGVHQRVKARRLNVDSNNAADDGADSNMFRDEEYSDTVFMETLIQKEVAKLKEWCMQTFLPRNRSNGSDVIPQETNMEKDEYGGIQGLHSTKKGTDNHKSDGAVDLIGKIGVEIEGHDNGVMLENHQNASFNVSPVSRCFGMSDMVGSRFDDHPIQFDITPGCVDGSASDATNKSPQISLGLSLSPSLKEIRVVRETVDARKSSLLKSRGGPLMFDHSPGVTHKRTRVTHEGPGMKSSKRNVDNFFNWLQSMRPTNHFLSRVCIFFGEPVFTSINGYQLWGQLYGNDKMDVAVMTAILALFKEDEDLMIGASKGTRERHYMFPAVSEHCMYTGLTEDGAEVFSHFFRPPYLSYDPSKCPYVMSTARVGSDWICFCFDLINEVITILDPNVPMGEWYSVHQSRNEAALQILRGLLVCLRVFNGATHFRDPIKWEMRHHQWNGTRPSSMEDDGFYAALMAVGFNGKEMCFPLTREKAIGMKKTICYRLQNRHQNPVSVTQLIADYPAM